MATPQQIRHLLAWFWHTSRGIRMKSIVNIVLGLLVVGMDFAFIWATKMTIDTATGQDDRPLWVGCALLVGIGLVNIGISFVRRWTSAILGVKSQNLMQLRAFSRLMHSVWTGKEQFHSGDVMNRLIRDANEITSVITDTLPAAICVSVRLLLAFLYLFHFDSWLAMVVLVLAPAFFLLSKVYIRKMRSLSREIRTTDSRIHSILQESIQHRMVLKTLEQTGGMVERLERTQEHLHGQVRHRTLFSSFSNLTVNFGFTAGYLLTFIWGVYRMEAGTITYGTMLAFIQLVGQIQGPVRTLSRFIPIFISTFTAAERLVELERIPLETAAGRPATGKADKAAAVQIRFDDVCYYYTLADGSHGRPILRHFSHTFAPGSITAVMGETGAGKTTLIRLLLALVRPTSGRVTAVAADGSESELQRATRGLFTYVPQGNTLISGTLRDNLLMACPEATEAEMLEALHLADADFVMDKATGLDTPCGEMGGGFSEGQAQRFAIARALLRRRPILLLDEATSALDAATEQRVLRRIVEARPGVTIIVVTHRPEVLRYCTDTIRLERLTVH